MKTSFFLLLIITLPFAGFAQQEKKSLKAANDLFEAGNYEAALQDYLSILPSLKDDAKLNYNIGVCYLNTNIDKSKAIPFLEKSISSAHSDPNSLFLLAKAFHFANRFDEAINYYTKFKSAGKGNNDNITAADREIEACYHAKELIKYPLNVTFENLGKNINSNFSDDFPFITKNESMLLFNSRREGNQQGLDGKYFSDVYLCKEKSGKWQQARALGSTINTPEGDEEIIGLSGDGRFALFMFDNNLGSGDLYISTIDGDNFGKPEKLPEVINSKYNEIAASLSIDGTIIYFASDRPGGFGGIDIYQSNKLPNGTWGPARNLGPQINTTFDEDFPNIALDGNSLLFSSKGHTSMGGYDIFKATKNDQSGQWENVKNFGYPINTAGDDMNLCLSENGRYGYLSSLRPGGSGDLDIYRVEFADVDAELTVFRGKLSSNDPSKNLGSVNITVNRVSDSELMGTYLPNPQTMKYVIILPPGKYEFVIESDGFGSVTEKVEVLGKASFKPFIEKDIRLMPN